MAPDFQIYGDGVEVEVGGGWWAVGEGWDKGGRWTAMRSGRDRRRGGGYIDEFACIGFPAALGERSQREKSFEGNTTLLSVFIFVVMRKVSFDGICTTVAAIRTDCKAGMRDFRVLILNKTGMSQLVILLF